MSDNQAWHYSNGDELTLEDLKTEVFFLKDNEIHISRAQENPTSIDVQGWRGVSGAELFFINLAEGLGHGSLCTECFNL